MKKSLLQRILMTLTLLFGAMSAASAADRFYIDAVNVEPDETKTLAFILDNDQELYGFQVDISLPDGLVIVTNNGKPDITLSSRADDSYTVVSNLLANGNVRLGAFSTSHTALSGNSGALLYMKVKANSDFVGGTLSMTNVIFIGANDHDIELDDYSIQLGTTHNDSFYIPDFKIAVGETKKIGVILDNETVFTAFQTDIYLPDGLTIVANSFKLSDRGANDHTISARSFSDGRTRVACFATNNVTFSGNSGVLLEFEIFANKDVAESCLIELKNQLFSTTTAKEYVLSNSTTVVTSERALVTAILLDYNSYTLIAGENLQILANIQPAFASTKDVEWSSSDPAIASVSANGLVSAIAPGDVIITCSAVDGSGVTATCNIKVQGIPVTGITLSRTSASLKMGETVSLSAIVAPANASDKSIVWTSSNSNIAPVDQKGAVTAVSVGNATIYATSASNPDVNAQCSINVVPTPVSSIVLTPTSISLQVGESTSVSANVSPATATNKEITWSSINSSIATIDEDGNIVAKSLGSTQIKATANDGSGVSATCMVTVIPTPVESISVTANGSTTLKAGQTVQLNATVLPETATDKTVVWSSSNTAIATVNSSGLVTAVAIGNASITATAGGKSSSVNITIEKTLAESITLNRTTAAMNVAGTMELSVVFTPETTTDKSVSWASSNPSIASVSDNGVVTAHALGNCRIAVTTKDGSNVSAYCDVTVGETAAESIRIEPKGPFSFKVGERVQLSATVLPETTTDKSVSWLAQSGAVSVDDNGLVTALALGTARVSATNSAGQVDYVDFTVVPTPVTTITLNSSAVQLKATETAKLEALVAPADATDKSLSWTSSSTAVATVDTNGNITAVSVGFSDIKATANDGSGVSATCKVTVIPTPVESVSVTANGPTALKAGQTVQLNATVLPGTATDKTVVWSSSNMAIATVNSSGLVTAVAIGNASITATAGDKTSSVDIVVEKTPVEAVEIYANSNSIYVGETMVLTARILPATATDKFVEWALSESGIVAINNSTNTTATIEALTPGVVNVVATSPDGISSSYEIKVLPILASSIIIDETTAKLAVGEFTQLTATVLPDNTTNKQVVWLSNNSQIASVSKSGLVHAVKPGSCEISASTGDGSDLSAICIVTVIQPVTAIALSEHDLSLEPRTTFALVATIEPIDATDKSVGWSSLNPIVAEVDDKGIISTLEEGETTISATTLDGSNLSDECKVTVKKDDSGIETITMDDVNITVNNNRVIISDLKNGSNARLYSLDGILLNSAAGNGSDIIFDITPNTYYILNIDNFSLKLTSK